MDHARTGDRLIAAHGLQSAKRFLQHRMHGNGPTTALAFARRVGQRDDIGNLPLRIGHRAPAEPAFRL